MVKSSFHSYNLRQLQRQLQDGSKMVALFIIPYMTVYIKIGLWLHSFIVYINSIGGILTRKMRIF